VELNIQKKVVMEYILLVYHESEKFRYLTEDSSSTLKLLLADNSVSENLLGQEYLSVLEETGRDVFYKLHAQKLALNDQREQIQQEEENLEGLNKSLNEERQIMEENRQTKKELLEETQGQEERYQQLLEESIQQQLQSAIAIQNMKENVEFIEEKLKTLDDSLTQVQGMQITNPEDVKKAEEQMQKIEQPAKEAPAETPEAQAEVRQHFFSWPVAPIAITSYFEDPTYPKKWGIHKALDIRAKQFTEIHAPANAYVFQTKDNGKGYSYIILAHKNKFVTVYGHVTDILVKAGDVVKEGDVIGLTGGTPGTKGAGWQTTGPHLHFEVWHNGAQVDPLEWLPVEQLPLEYIPDRFLTQLAPIGVGK